jgi:hypothetical protein
MPLISQEPNQVPARNDNGRHSMDIKPRNHQKANEPNHPDYSKALATQSTPLQGTEQERNRTRAGIPMPGRCQQISQAARHGA